jgi:hypothetical protein
MILQKNFGTEIWLLILHILEPVGLVITKQIRIRKKLFVYLSIFLLYDTDPIENGRNIEDADKDGSFLATVRERDRLTYSKAIYHKLPNIN